MLSLNVSAQLTYSHGYFLKFPHTCCLSLSFIWENESSMKWKAIKLVPATHPGGGGWGLGGSPGLHPVGGWGVWSEGISRPTPSGDWGSGWWVSRPTSGGPGPGGVYPNMHWGRPPPADVYCCGRYACYWNAFLFYSIIQTLAINFLAWWEIYLSWGKRFLVALLSVVS